MGTISCCSVVASLGPLKALNALNRSVTATLNDSKASDSSTDAFHSGVAFMPSVRKYWVNSCPGMLVLKSHGIALCKGTAGMHLS